MEDQFYREVTEIEGQRGIEAIEGAWICKMGELLALKRTKDVEMVKSHVSRQVDAYRRPFDKRVDEHPRQCIFIGTTNNIEFLTDKTGNRRYYPVVCNHHGRDLFDHEGTCVQIVPNAGQKHMSDTRLAICLQSQTEIFY